MLERCPADFAEDGTGLPPNIVLVCFVGSPPNDVGVLAGDFLDCSSTGNKDVKMLINVHEESATVA
jgi:hypothetical protein